MINEQILKICLAGNSEFKADLARWITGNTFQISYTSIMGVDISTQRIAIDNHQYTLLMVDTTGQEHFGMLWKAYAVASLIFFDVVEKNEQCD